MRRSAVTNSASDVRFGEKMEVFGCVESADDDDEDDEDADGEARAVVVVGTGAGVPGREGGKITDDDESTFQRFTVPSEDELINKEGKVGLYWTRQIQ